MNGSPVSPLAREHITQPLVTGIRAIDGLLPCGKGQRIGIFGGSGVGKSTLLGSMSRHNSADVTVIAMIGERNREVRGFLENELGPEGRKRSVVSSWKLLASTTWMTSRAVAATCAESATPMLPPTATLRPPSSSMRPTSVVVVDLPFVPVIATTRPSSQRDASSSSPMTGTPAARARATSAWRGETPGLSTIRSALVNVSARWLPRSKARSTSAF